MKKYAFILSLLITTSCMAQTTYKTIGTLERYDDALDKLVSKDAKAEIIADGFLWAEGPCWVEKYKMLLFSDVRRNTVFKWTEKNGKEVYLTPSGYTGTVPRGGEMGSNGLTLDNKGKLVLCQDGDRKMSGMDAPLDKPEPKFVTLADKWDGKKFNSPNDAVFNSKGELYFTDPPYGLVTGSDTDPAKEIKFNGVYKVKKNGEVILLVDSLTRPNGIAFFPGEKQILIANSDPKKANWYIYDVDGDKLKNGRIFYSATGVRGAGLPDGFRIDKKGNVYSAGPGGLHIFNKEGKLLGKLVVPGPTSNCSMSADQKTLYITNNNQVLRFKMRN